MNIQTLKLHNYRMFENLELNFDPHYSVIVGVNGAGKTTILEAAATAAGALFQSLNGIYKYNIKKNDAHRKYFPLGSNTDVQTQFPVEDEAVGTINGKCIHWKRTLQSGSGKPTLIYAKDMTSVSTEYQTRLQTGDASLILPILAYYGTGRLWDHKEKKDDVFNDNTRINGYVGCLDGIPNNKLMMNWFEKMTIQKYQRQEVGLNGAPELMIVYRAISRCLEDFTGYKNVKIQYSLDVGELIVYYTDSINRNVNIPLSMLSDGFKEIISIVADIAYRMAVLNPQLLENVLKETDGIVLIDEVDLHLHPAWQQRIITSLISIFPKVQFIVTTHAPAVINSVEKEHLIILRDGETAPANSQTYGKDVNSVLREIMGTNERPSEVSALFAKFYAYLTEKQFDQASDVLDRLDEMRDYHDPEVAGCRVKLKLEKIRGGNQ